MNISSELTDTAVLRTLGQRIERYRIEARLTQAELAEQAGIGKRTLERIEAGSGAELVTLIRVLRALRLLEGFERLLPPLPPSPIEQLKLRGRQRRRVSHRRTSQTPATEQGAARAKPWTWDAPPEKTPGRDGSRRPRHKS